MLAGNERGRREILDGCFKVFERASHLEPCPSHALSVCAVQIARFDEPRAADAQLTTVYSNYGLML